MAVQIVHQAGEGRGRSGDEVSVLATDVSIAETTLERLKGVMFQETLPPEYGLVFPFERATKRGVHTLFVHMPIDVVWTVDGRVTGVETLHPWIGHGRERADTIVELPAGAAARVSVGDRVVLRD